MPSRTLNTHLHFLLQKAKFFVLVRTSYFVAGALLLAVAGMIIFLQILSLKENTKQKNIDNSKAMPLPITELTEPTPIPGFPRRRYTIQQRIGFNSYKPAQMKQTPTAPAFIFNWSHLGASEALGIPFIRTAPYWKKGSFPPDQDIQFVQNVPPESIPTMSVSSGRCAAILKELYANRATIPPVSRWVMGNEVGWIPNDTPQAAATAYIQWSRCVKAIGDKLGKRFEIGTGAMIGIYHRLPKPEYGSGVGSCVYDNWNGPDSIDDSNVDLSGQGKEYTQNGTTYYSGSRYFELYLREIQNQGGQINFVTSHIYFCSRNPHVAYGDKAPQLIETTIRRYRQIMKDAGLQNVDLIINESSVWIADLHRYYIDYVARNPGAISLHSYLERYLSHFYRLMSSLKENVPASIGNPNDEGRLVQQWAWFITANTQYDDSRMAPWPAPLTAPWPTPPFASPYPLLPTQGWIGNPPNKSVDPWTATENAVSFYFASKGRELIPTSLATKHTELLQELINNEKQTGSCSIKVNADFIFVPDINGIRVSIQGRNNGLNETKNMQNYQTTMFTVPGGQYYTLTLDTSVPEKQNLVRYLKTNITAIDYVNRPGGYTTTVQYDIKPSEEDLSITQGVNKRIDVFCPLPLAGQNPPAQSMVSVSVSTRWSPTPTPMPARVTPTSTPAPTPTPYCKDSDGGTNYMSKGTIRASNLTTATSDMCQGRTNTLREWRCLSQPSRAESVLYNCAESHMSCVNGTCVKPTPSPIPYCKDSDGGRVYTKRGTVEASNVTTSVADYCLASDGTSATVIREWYCVNGAVTKTDFDCKNLPNTPHCSLGACVAIKSNQRTPPPVEREVE